MPAPQSRKFTALASALPRPVGFKNGTDGNIRVAIDAIQAMKPTRFIAPAARAAWVVIKRKGQPGQPHHFARRHPPQLPPERRGRGSRTAGTAGALPRLMVDCSHGNSQKLHKNQIRVAGEPGRQPVKGQRRHRRRHGREFPAGGQPETGPSERNRLTGQSVTDACLCWDDTQTLLAMLADAVRARRRQYPGQPRPDPVRWPAQLAS
ncbi:hypothetical protein [Aeromonas dhakensis]|uniref:hypothetical protein n=1 Tax=Aeromonas dhakensis TaxID=196024 RepID=UPI00341F7315